MPRDPSSGVLVFASDATVQHVDPAAAALLNADRTALLDGTAAALQATVSVPDGPSYDSFLAFVEQVLRDDAAARTAALPDDLRAEARVTYGAEAPSGVVVTVHPSPTTTDQELPPASAPDAASPLGEHLRLLAAAVEHAHVPVLVTEAEPLDAPGPPIVYANPAFAEVTGYTREEVRGRSPRFLQGAETDRVKLDRIRSALEAETPVRETVLNYKKDGSPYWNDVYVAPMRGPGGTVTHYVSVQADVTTRREAEGTLREHRDLLRRTQEMANVGGWVYDAQTNAMEGTDETHRIYDLPLDAELTLEQSLSFYPPEMAATLRTAAERCLAHGEPFDEEGPMVTPKDTRRWVRVRGEPRRDDEGSITKMVGTVQDLTERHAIEERLREQKEWLQSITENVAGGIYRSTEEDGLVYANQALLDLFGYESLEEMASVDPTSLYAHPEVREALIRREAEQNGLAGVEVEYRRKDGSTFTGLLRSTQVLGDDGAPKYYDGVVTDITEQKEREEKLRAQGQKMNVLYETTERLLPADGPETVADRVQHLLDEAFTYPLMGVSFVEDEMIVPKRVTMADDYDMPPIQPLDLDGDSLAARALQSGETVTRENLRVPENDIPYGDLRSAVCVPIEEAGVIYLGHTEPGPFDAFDLNLIDVLAKKAAAVLARIEHERQLKSAKQEAEEASRLKSALLANMSHEIRTPLTSIIGFADLLQNNTSGRNARHASLIRRGGERLMDTLDSVLQLSKLEAGMVAPPTPQVMDLRSAAQETIELFRPDAESAGVRLQFESAPATVTGQWDSAAIQRVLSNLLSNAIKFTPEDGTVTVRVARQADEAVLTVSDTGIGISDAFRPRLFEAFTQESEGLEREHEGSGLGLAVVKRLVELMDGQIDVESTKGEGTCFRVRLPRPDPDPDA